VRLATLDLNGSGTAAVVLRGEGAVVVRDSAGRVAYPDVGALLAAGDGALEAAQRALTDGDEQPYGSGALRRPILAPGAVFCVGLNYGTHITEMGRELPTHPTLFSKLSRALTDPYADIDVPAAGAARLDYEGELVAVIGKAARNVDAAEAMSHVAGLTVLNDVTMRDYQWRSPQWFAGKTWERSTPVGPAVVTLDELDEHGDVGARELVVTVNDEERQRARLGDLVFGVADLVEDISRIVTLEPGDLIATGTPGGVGDAMDPKGYVGDGDVVEVRIDGLGSVRNRITVRP
jgi:acylpyruvate hydrolase